MNNDYNNFNDFSSQEPYDATRYSTASNYTQTKSRQEIASEVIVKSFVVMVIAMVVTALASVIVATNQDLCMNVYSNGTYKILLITDFIIAMAAQLTIRKNNVILSGSLFLAYSILTGVTLSCIFYVFELSSIYNIFIIASILFAIMAAVGYFTKRDMARLGNILIMSLLGIVITEVLNLLFFHASGIELIVDFIGVFVFIGLTAYDTQKMRRIAENVDETNINVMSIYCGMELYLDLLNLILRLLALFGKKRN